METLLPVLIMLGFVSLVWHATRQAAQLRKRLVSTFPEETLSFIGGNGLLGSLGDPHRVWFLWDPRCQELAARDADLTSMRRRALLTYKIMIAWAIGSPLLAVLYLAFPAS